ncbi:hypothetical protein B0H17DRAFT_1211168 [Mycena rosella]|uniref:Uncharacterized protein n=1 Tax=Mycena rosella TaxID=1033263 RepID=A0AAD7CUP6_MYCRO|nr:hypothetical protein B0H17DRAFT_1211168 [Mycena rosella]
MSPPKLKPKKFPDSRKPRIRQLNRRQTLQKYSKANLESLRDKARLRMQKKRAERKNSEDLLKASQEQRRQWDTEYHERVRRQQFIKKHGTKKFQDHYVPLLNEFNKFDLTGVRIPGLADSEGEERHSENTEDKSCCDSDDD